MYTSKAIKGGFRPFNFENTILTHGLGVMAWTCTNNFWGGFGSMCAMLPI